MTIKRIDLANVVDMVDKANVFTEKVDFLFQHVKPDEQDENENIVCLAGDIINYFRQEMNDLWEKISTAPEMDQKKDLFDDDKLLEYLMQIKVNGGDPVKIFEGWIKEHTPDYFKDS